MILFPMYLMVRKSERERTWRVDGMCTLAPTGCGGEGVVMIKVLGLCGEQGRQRNGSNAPGFLTTLRDDPRSEAGMVEAGDWGAGRWFP